MEVNAHQVYFDHAATTKVDPQVAASLWHWLTEGYGNPSSEHQLGRKSRDIVAQARYQVATLIGAGQSEIIFTSGGTESNNMALWGVLLGSPDQKNRLITSEIEHASILKNIPLLRQLGYEITVLPVDSLGRVKYEDLERNLASDVALVSIMYANNEVGTIQDIKRFSKITRANGALFHTDAIQALGWCKLDVKDLGVDLLSISGHKIYGPKGIGALYVRHGLDIQPLIFGGGQEFDLRGGTENVPGIVGLGVAASLTAERLNYVETIKCLRDYLWQLLSQVSGVRFYGDVQFRLPNNCAFSIADYNGKDLVLDLDSHGFCCSTGSACQRKQPSHVLAAMGVSACEMRRAVRVSLGWDNTYDEIERFVDTIYRLVTKKKLK